MSRQNRDRHVWGATNPIHCPTANDEMIMTGDLCYIATSSLYPMSYVIGDEPDADSFVGVAMQYAIDRNPTEVRVATDGVFEFDCSDTFLVGEGVYQMGHAQFVYGIGDRTTTAGIIGRAWKRYPSTTTKVLVKIDNKAFFQPAST